MSVEERLYHRILMRTEYGVGRHANTSHEGVARLYISSRGEQPSHPNNTITSQSGIARPRSNSNLWRLGLSWSDRERGDDSELVHPPFDKCFTKRVEAGQRNGADRHRPLTVGNVDICLRLTRLCPMSAAHSKKSARIGKSRVNRIQFAQVCSAAFSSTQYFRVGAADESAPLTDKIMRAEIEHEQKRFSRLNRWLLFDQLRGRFL